MIPTTMISMTILQKQLEDGKSHQEPELGGYQTPAAETRVLESSVSGKILVFWGIFSGFENVSWKNQEVR